jgi:hypothetical protein
MAPPVGWLTLAVDPDPTTSRDIMHLEILLPRAYHLLPFLFTHFFLLSTSFVFSRFFSVG